MDDINLMLLNPGAQCTPHAGHSGCVSTTAKSIKSNSAEAACEPRRAQLFLGDPCKPWRKGSNAEPRGTTASRRIEMRPACHQTLPLQQREICLANRSLGGASDASERGADEDEGPLVLLEDGVQDSLKLS